MTVCVRIKGKRRQLCSGDLDREIMLQNRSITAPSALGDADYGEDFEDDGVEPCMIITVKPREVFDETNTLIGTVDTEFYIRYRDDVTSQSWIDFENVRYNIISTEDLDLRHEWLKLNAELRGPVTTPVNES